MTGLANKGMRRGLATTIVVVSGIALIGGFIALFGGALATQIAELVAAMPALILDLVQWLNSTFDANIDPVEITSNLNLTTEQITAIASSLAGGIFGVVFSVLGVAFSLLTVAVFSFYFAADSPRIKRVYCWVAPTQQANRFY